MTALNKQALREQIESAADAYWQFDNGWISDMKCGDLSHEYLLFVKEPKNVLALLDSLEAAEKRIAELEARAVNLPKRSVGEVMHMSGFSRDYAEGWCAGNDNAIHEIRAAGIGVKGE